MLNKIKKYNKRYISSKDRGFTLIETMVAVIVFLVVIIYGTNSLLNIYFNFKYTNKARALLDNVSFVMEDMRRHLKTGYNYVCDVDPNNYDTKSCSEGGSVIYFKEALSEPGALKWGYRIFINDNGEYSIGKSVDGGGSWIPLTDPNEIKIDSSSKFFVLGAEPPPGDNRQPFVIIRLKGEVNYKDYTIPFYLQNAISQFNPDVGS